MAIELVEQQGAVFSVIVSNGVNCSADVNESNGVNESGSVNGSNGVNWSDNVTGSNGVNGSGSVNGSNGVNESSSVNGSDGVNWSDGVYESNGVNESFGIVNSYGVDRAIFLSNKPRNCSIFGKNVSEERYAEVYENMNRLFDGWLPAFNNSEPPCREIGSRGEMIPVPQKEEAWQDMPKPAIDYISSLPEFDAEIFYDVTGINVKCEG